MPLGYLNFEGLKYEEVLKANGRYCIINRFYKKTFQNETK
jgi:hypothetical protein